MSSAFSPRAVRAGAAASLLAVVGALAACSDTKDATTGAISTSTGVTATADPRTTTDCARATQNPAKVVCLASAFAATLSATQQATLVQAYTSANATRWSNLPTSLVTRLGVKFSDLSATQQAAALNLFRAALSSAGYAQVQSIRAADTYLHNAQNGITASGVGAAADSGPPPRTPGDTTRPGPPGGGLTLAFGDSLYYVAFLGTPSVSSPWILKIDGHHLAINLHYNGTQAPTPTPNFIGVEPQAFTLNGVAYTPLQTRKVAMYTLVNSLDSAQYAAAQLGSTFTDVLLGPGQDGKFPAHQGVLASALSAAQRQLVKNAIEAWVKDFPSTEANNLLATYEDPAALAQTYVGSSGGRDSTVQGSYVRIDGPRVWIEFACQNGVVFQNQIHFHTIWRDRQQDYGGDFTF